MSTLTFGALRFDRYSIPDHLRDLAHWPSVDVSALEAEDREVFLARQRAIELYLGSPKQSVRSIQAQTGVDTKTIHRVCQRCMEKHRDGRIYGFRAAIPYSRLKQYERVQDVDRHEGAQGRGLAGAFSLLLRQYPQIAVYLERQAKKRHRPITKQGDVRKPIREIHKRFLELCREAGVKANEYPLNQQNAGFRSLNAYFKRYDDQTFESSARKAGADRVGPPMPGEIEEAPAATRAFEVVEFDGHKIDLRVTVRVIDPFGFETLLELTRIWILVLLDVASRAVIGYKVALSKEYNKDDVAAALQAALTPFKPRKYVIPDLSIRAGGGYPSMVLPQAQYACWEWFRFDGARCHLAADTITRLTQVVGCWPDNGPAGEPDERPYIERFFQLVSTHFAHRLPGTTGATTDSAERALCDPHGDIRLLVELQELEDMIEVLIGDYNGETHKGISSRTPLEAMGQLLTRHPGYVRTLPRIVRQNLCLLQEARVVTIKGSAEKGVRPHINFLDVRYSSDILSSSPGVIGKKLRIYFDVRDIRTLKAFFEDGTELGVLIAASPWCYTPHSVRVRQEIGRLYRAGKLKYREGDDPVEAWGKFKHKQAKTNKRAATELARARYESGACAAVPPAPPRTNATPAQNEVMNEHGGPVGVSGATSSPGKLADAKPEARVLKIRRTFTF